MSNGNGHISFELVARVTLWALVGVLTWIAMQQMGRISALEDRAMEDSLKRAVVETRREYEAGRVTKLEARVEELSNAMARGQVAVIPREDRRRD